MIKSPTLKHLGPLAGGLLLALAFLAATRVHFLFFHTLIELSCVASTWVLFSLAWGSRDFSENSYFSSVAAGALFWGMLDAVHALMYKGMTVIPYGDANFALQSWIAARFLQSVSLLLAPHLMKHKFNARYLLSIYAVTTLALFGIISMQWFPTCYIEGVGLTPFKRAAECGVILVLLGAMAGLWEQRRRFDSQIAWYLQGALLLFVASEVCFAVYVDSYDAFNVAGHLLRFGAIYFFYYMFVKMSLRKPYIVLFRELNVANEQLRESEARYRLLADHAVDVIWTMDLEGRFTYMSPSVERLRGYTAEEVVATTLEQVLTPSSLEVGLEAFARLRRAVSRGEPYETLERLELEQFCRDGSTVWTESYIKVMYDGNGDFISVLGVTRDISQRKQAELALHAYTRQLEASNAELDAFAHTVAHDLKSPLTALIGFAGLLEKRADVWTPERIRQSAQRILMTAYKLTSIIEELMLLAGVRRMEDIPHCLLDMSSLIRNVRERLALLIEERQPEIYLPDSWPTAIGYGPWVEEIWANYISNAIKYGGAPPRVELGWDIVEGPAQGIGNDGRRGNLKSVGRFWVRDNGVGLTLEQQRQLFAEFTRMHQTHAQGHGLGLSIVRRIIGKLGGQVGVESRPGEGSIFYFTLPVEAIPLVKNDERA
ncbi:MAG: PAS domain S-box protein [Anaerolineae bacterium]|nr:PAS domain S-box protein [Anaerolineae bacterium]